MPQDKKNFEKQDVEVLRKKIAEKVSKNPKKAATVLADWIRRPAAAARKTTNYKKAA